MFSKSYILLYSVFIIGALSLSLDSILEPLRGDVDPFQIMLKGVTTLQRYGTDLIEGVTHDHPDLGSQVDDLRLRLSRVSQYADDFRKELPKNVSDKRVLQRDSVKPLSSSNTSSIEDELALLFESLFLGFNITFPPLSEAPSHDERAILLAGLFQLVGDHFCHLISTKYQLLTQDRCSEFWQKISPELQIIALASGDIIEQHSDLIKAVLISATFLLLPEAFPLRPLLWLIGLGPVKGPSAAWIQRSLYGAEVPRKRWLSHMWSALSKYASDESKKALEALRGDSSDGSLMQGPFGVVIAVLVVICWMLHKL